MKYVKAVLRGKITAFCASEKKRMQLRLSELNRELKELETKHKEDIHPNLVLKLKEIRTEINTLLSQERTKNDLYKTKVQQIWFKICKASSKEITKTTGAKYNLQN